MRKVPVAVLLLIFANALLLLGGCVRAKLYNPPTQSFAPLPLGRVEAILIECLNRKGWVPTPDGPNALRGTLHIEDHTAIIRIEYTDRSYAIRYLWSEQLNYGKGFSGELIQENYNLWVEALVKDINVQLAAIPAAPG